MRESYQQVNNLSLEETLLFTLKIKDSLCQSPYACASILQTFEAPDEFNGYNKYDHDARIETINERIISLQLANNCVTDDILNRHIDKDGAQLVQTLFEEREW